MISVWIIESVVNLKSQIDNKHYVNSDTLTVHVNCVQCGAIALTVMAVFQEHQQA